MSKKEIKLRHSIIKAMAVPFFNIVLAKNHVKRIKHKDIKGPCLLLCNHQTGNDQFYVADMFRGNPYFVASEDIFSLGIISDLLEFALNPIMKMKNVPDIATVRKCSEIIKEGGIVLLFPEGNRTYSGKQCYMDEATAKFVKLLNVDTYFINFVGGYAFQPRWCNKNRKVKSFMDIRCKLSKEEMRGMDNKQLLDVIKQNLDVYEEEGKLVIKDEKRRAEYLERLFYVCPKCGSISTLVSDDNEVHCTNCDFRAIYNKDQTFSSNVEAIDGRRVDTWYDLQNKWLVEKDASFFDKYLFIDKGVQMKQSIVNKRKIFLGKGILRMNSKYMQIYVPHYKYTFAIDDIISMTCVAKHKLNIYLKGNTIYQFNGDERFNAYKYMTLYYHLKNLKEGKTNEQFLGI